MSDENRNGETSMPERELISTELYGGAHDGRGLRLDPDVELVVLSGAIYQRGPDGVFRYCESRHTPTEIDDRVFKRTIEVFGLDSLVDMLAIDLVRKCLDGNPAYWKLLADRISRMRGTP